MRKTAPADDFDPAHKTNIEVVNPALTVGQCRWQIINEYLDAADAEIGLRAEAPNRNPQVLGEVVAVLEEDTRHPAQ